MKSRLRASSPGHSGGGAGKARKACNSSLEFEYLHRKSRCEMLIGRDGISNDVIILGTCFSMFVYIRARFRFALTGGYLTAQSTGSHRWNSQLQGLLPFPAPPPERPESLLAGFMKSSGLLLSNLQVNTHCTKDTA